ncbi:hypothetical protein [Nocardia wallacei]|uniref:hypothetical protein n=1 Tax=Nocardia wallacei TaxID=480035 RepID=UPI0024545E23|nr:hypothetical protein [Nocardia wallacei]
MADWQKISGIATVVAIPISILIAVAQCGAGSNDPTPPTSSTTAGAGGSGHAVPPSASSGPSEQPWPGDPTGASFQTGTISITAYTNLGGDSFNLDKNKTENGIAEGSDLVAQEAGLGANNGTQVARWSGPESPTLHDCRQLPDVEYAKTELIDAGSFETATRYCVRSSEGRFGRIHTISARGGNFPQFNFSYVLWKKPGDK